MHFAITALACVIGGILGGGAFAAIWPRHYCVKCGRNRAGRMVGGTVDSPICIDCDTE